MMDEIFGYPVEWDDEENEDPARFFANWLSEQWARSEARFWDIPEDIAVAKNAPRFILGHGNTASEFVVWRGWNEEGRQVYEYTYDDGWLEIPNDR